MQKAALRSGQSGSHAAAVNQKLSAGMIQVYRRFFALKIVSGPRLPPRAPISAAEQQARARILYCLILS
jgi:hypothetical protein